MSRSKLEEVFSPELKEKFFNLYSLRMFIENSVLPDQYEPSSRMTEAIVLTTEGEEWNTHLSKVLPDSNEDDRRLAIFAIFGYWEPFVDIENSDTSEFMAALSEQVRSLSIRYPWTYERILTDRTTDLLGPWSPDKRQVPYKYTRQLLEDSFQGVFQLHRYVVGPFGILLSAHPRYAPPDRSIRARCSDAGCSYFHPFFLNPGDNGPNTAYLALHNELARKYASEQRTEWQQYFVDELSGFADRFNDLRAEGFQVLLANAFSEKELRRLFAHCLNGPSGGLSTALPRRGQLQGLFAGTGEEIADRLNKAQCLQLLLLINDSDLINGLEVLIDNRSIDIPASETRTSVWTWANPGNWWDLTARVSDLGIRWDSQETSLASSRLIRLLTSLYSRETDAPDLEWKLRGVGGDSALEKLETYVNSHQPNEILKELVLVSLPKLTAAFSLLGPGHFDIPTNEEEELRLIDKILWKLGFNVPRHPSYLPMFWQRLDKFLGTARQFTSYGEHERELIRASGVNFFVSLEEVLEHSLAFSTYVLLNDHYALDRNDRFRCSLMGARQFMVSQLDGRSMGSGRPVNLDSSGRNTLYPLIHGFGVLAALCTEIRSDADRYRRSSSDLPLYYGKTDLEIMPFAHTVPLLDIRQEDGDRLINLFLEVTQVLEGAAVGSVRNGVNHKRERFPSLEEIEVACSAITQIIGKLESAGACPNVYIYNDRVVDAYGRSTYTLKDYRGRAARFFRPYRYSKSGMPALRAPQFVMSWAHIDDSTEVLRLIYQEESDYVRMWRNYVAISSASLAPTPASDSNIQDLPSDELAS